MNNFSLPENRYKLNLPLLKNFDYKKLDEEVEQNKKKIENPFDDTTLIEMKPTHQKLNDLRENILDTLQKEHFFWDCQKPKLVQEDNFYRWDLPESNFEEESEINQVHLQVYTFHSERNKLNREQLRDVWESRTFKVESEIPDLPHKWELSPWLINSSQEKRHFLRSTVAFCWSLLFAMLNVLNPCSPRVFRKGSLPALFEPNLFNVFVSVWASALNLFEFLFGLRFRALKSNYRVAVKANVVKKHFLRIKRDEARLPETCALLEYLFLPEQSQFDLTNPVEKKKFEKRLDKIKSLQKKLYNASTKFDKDYETRLTEALNKEDFEEEELELIRSDFESKKQDMLCGFLEENKDKFENQHLLDLLIGKLKCHNQFLVAKSKLEADKLKMEAEERETMQKKFPIYSLIQYKFDHLLRKKLEIKNEFAHEQMLQDFSATLRQNNRPEEVLLVENYNNFRSKEDALYKKELREFKRFKLSPVQTLKLPARRYPCCYEVVDNSTANNPSFFLQKWRDFEISSNYPGYKLVFGVFGYLVDLHNSWYHLTRWFWDGPLGLKVLLFCKDFYRNDRINYRTGEYSRQKHDRVRPVLRKFTAILKGMSIYRRKFEEQPDTGLFGKNVGRLCMYLECIFIRFLLIGVVLILVINPACILINLAMTLFLMVTAFLWVLGINLILLAFKLVLFDYNSTLSKYSFLRDTKDKDIFGSPMLSLIFSYQFLPLVKQAIDIVFQIGIQTALVICILVLAPVLSVVLLVGGVILFVLKNIWDWVILNLIIKCCARVPSSNTSYAVRISGPGVSRDFYNSLESRHLSLLVIAHLERCELDQIKEEVQHILNSPREYIESQYSILFKNFTYSTTSNVYMNKSFQNLEFLKMSLDHHIQKRKDRLPRIATGKHTVRFTEEDLERNQVIVQGILREVIEEKSMNHYIWKKYDLREGLFKRLTRKVLQDILTKNALEAVEKVDQFQQVQYSKNSVNEYVSKVVMNEDQSYNLKKKRKLQIIENLRLRRLKNPSIYTNITSLFQFFSTANYDYEHPFRFYPIHKKSVVDWKEESRARREK